MTLAVVAAVLLSAAALAVADIRLELPDAALAVPTELAATVDVEPLLVVLDAATGALASALLLTALAVADGPLALPLDAPPLVDAALLPLALAVAPA